MAKRTCSRCPKAITRYSKTGMCLDCAHAARRKPAAVPAASVIESGNTATATAVVEVRSLEALLAACSVDLEVWEVERWLSNKWEMGYVDKAKQAHTRQLWQVKAWFKRKTALLAVKDEIASIVEDARRALPDPIVYPDLPTGDGYSIEVAIPDLHAGKLAWRRETGDANYDTPTAVAVAREAFSTLLALCPRVNYDEVVITLGNDLLNADGNESTTTKGTQVDTDTRYKKTFTAVRKLAVDLIEQAKQIAPRVKVIMVPGNHDEETVWHLGDSLAMRFFSDPTVEVDNSPKLRKYHRFGQNLLMFTHGDKEQISMLPLIMAREQPRAWGETVHREVRLGHLHKTKADEIQGVRVSVSPALCPSDAWHAGKGYHQTRGAEAFIRHRTTGRVATVYYTVPEERAA